MPRTAPPFRADHVGSLLRPPALKEARLKRERNEITAEACRPAGYFATSRFAHARFSGVNANDGG